MPRGDRTGPESLGPETGRAAGLCAGSPVPGYMNRNRMSGVGFGRQARNGFQGQGFKRVRHGFGRFAGMQQELQFDADNQKSVLVKQMDLLQAKIDMLRNKLETMDAASNKEEK